MLAPVLFCRDKRLSLAVPRVMGVLNATPDSFSDGGRYLRNGRIDPSVAAAVAEQMVADGAAIIDVGGELLSVAENAGTRQQKIGQFKIKITEHTYII